MSEDDKKKLIAAASIGIYAALYVAAEASKSAMRKRLLRKAKIKEIDGIKEAAIRRLQRIANDPNSSGKDIMKAAVEEQKFIGIVSQL